MTRIYRSNPARLREPGLRDAIVVDTVRGRVRVRAWPKKRGRPKSAAVREQNQWFKDANRLSKLCSAQQVKAAMIATKGSGLYPRDILLRSMAGNLGPLQFVDGQIMRKRQREFEDLTFQGCILELAAPTSFSGGAITYPAWDLPVIDTAGFWSVTNPSRITIPAIARVIRLDASCLTETGDNTSIRGVFRRNGSTFEGHQNVGNFSTSGLSMSLGPMVANPGDYWEVGFNPSNTDTFVAGVATAFALTVLETQ